MQQLFNYFYFHFKRKNDAEPEFTAVIHLSLGIGGLLCSLDFLLIHFLHLNRYYAIFSFAICMTVPLVLLLRKKAMLKDVAEATQSKHSALYGFVAYLIVFIATISLVPTMLILAKFQ